MEKPALKELEVRPAPKPTAFASIAASCGTTTRTSGDGRWWERSGAPSTPLGRSSAGNRPRPSLALVPRHGHGDRRVVDLAAQLFARLQDGDGAPHGEVLAGRGELLHTQEADLRVLPALCRPAAAGPAGAKPLGHETL